MIQTAKKLIAGALLLTGAALFLGGCGGTSPAGSGSNAKSSYTDKLVVGTGGLLPMWTQQGSDASTDQGLEGFDIDMMKEICRRNNWELTFKHADFSALWGMLDSGQIDTIANETTSNAQRLEKYHFTKPYASESYVFVVKKGTNPPSLDWFKGKSVDVHGTSNPRLVLEEMNEKKNLGLSITYMDSLPTQWPPVLQGQMDAAFTLRSAALIAVNDLKMDLEIYDPQYKYVPIMYPFTKNEKNQKRIDAVNKTIEDMRKDGTIKKLSEKWFKMDLSQIPDNLQTK